MALVIKTLVTFVQKTQLKIINYKQGKHEYLVHIETEKAFYRICLSKNCITIT